MWANFQTHLSHQSGPTNPILPAKMSPPLPQQVVVSGLNLETKTTWYCFPLLSLVLRHRPNKPGKGVSRQGKLSSDCWEHLAMDGRVVVLPNYICDWADWTNICKQCIWNMNRQDIAIHAFDVFTSSSNLCCSIHANKSIVRRHFQTIFKKLVSLWR